jgi:hypothetical protein
MSARPLPVPGSTLFAHSLSLGFGKYDRRVVVCAEVRPPKQLKSIDELIRRQQASDLLAKARRFGYLMLFFFLLGRIG